MSKNFFSATPAFPPLTSCQFFFFLIRLFPYYNFVISSSESPRAFAIFSMRGRGGRGVWGDSAAPLASNMPAVHSQTISGISGTRARFSNVPPLSRTQSANNDERYWINRADDAQSYENCTNTELASVTGNRFLASQEVCDLQWARSSTELKRWSPSFSLAANYCANSKVDRICWNIEFNLSSVFWFAATASKFTEVVR